MSHIDNFIVIEGSKCYLMGCKFDIFILSLAIIAQCSLFYIFLEIYIYIYANEDP